MDSIHFCGIKFRGLEQAQLFKEDIQTHFVVTVNAEFIVKANRNKPFRDIISANYATFDGQIPYFFARLLNRGKHFSKISGSDLIYDACEHAQQHGKRLFLLGGNAKANALAVQNIHDTYGLDVAGYAPPYAPYPFTADHNEAIKTQISQFKPDFLFVAFGAVKQEYWINDNFDFLQQQQVHLVVGCGGTFDFVSGQVKRAPRLLQRAGLECLWRLVTEPRLFRLKRLLESTLFFSVLYSHHLSQRKHLV
ncbi:WecB/TagA/CpsF family glycosyltransferase [Thiothrix subterranea]|uniref:WecB/TagA/CpsF family glycosyltransferase n=1 Tax=Thiothrix subterranea TaxID=2735563 RepID=UPI00192C19F2|nr:WecB/TagA/CpsF family glycosyltransferase [Thiothrix subterranea]QQZ28263.1 WecB/TagA/CpsF family glycosyltransferase [Thiothrix subterranea]